MGLSQQQEGESRLPVRVAGPVVPVYVLLHGGGLSSLSWALVARTLKRHGRPALAYDFRAHGGSTGDELELTAEQLCSDTISVIEAVVGTEAPLVIVGHSLGGAIAAKVSCTPKLRDRVTAVAMIDIVESVAMSSLDKMEEMVARKFFKLPVASSQLSLHSNHKSCRVVGMLRPAGVVSDTS